MKPAALLDVRRAWAAVRLGAARAVRLPAQIGWRDHAIGAGLGLAYLAWLLATARAIGFPRDESIYFHAASQYAGWWRTLLERPHAALEPGAIDAAFSMNREHPALMKTLFGLSEWLFHQKWRVFADASAAYRMPGSASAAVAVWTTYLFGARAWGRRAGLIAAALLAAMPRVFFHAHLACFDVPITAVWIVCVYVHWRAQERRSLLWALATGVVFGLALETKHNAWVLPFALVPHALFVHRHAIARGLAAGRVALPASVVSMATVGPAVFYALWPYLWHDGLARLQWYVDFHLNHEYYNIEFLGKNYFGPPSPKAYLPVMVLATVPTITILLFGVGAAQAAAVGARRLWAWTGAATGRGLRTPARSDGARPDAPGAAPARAPRDPRETDLLLALSIAVAVGPFFLPATPIFGGTKHWMPAYPALALLAGRGFELVAAAMRRAVAAGMAGARLVAAEAALGTCVVAAPLAETAHACPFGLSAYVPLVGGAAGAADLGLNRQFWGFTSQNAAEEYLNAKAPPGASVFIHDTMWDAWTRMQQEGRVRGDLRATMAPSDATIALVEHELHMNEVDYSVWVALGTDAPAYIVTYDGVPIVSVYRR
ncbi:MAG TPA: glycosyltransferase family 39 protein [Polyangiaceae bacterium]|nr:glycosyltransferase family 39 protein [Polyangiaceae bacterium]